MQLTIALAGNPNSGKTTLFNSLTGANQTVGNWPGVTVEKKSGKYKKDKSVNIIDLPGIYSLSPYTPEEVVSRNYLIDKRPDVIINIIDGSNLERNLYLTTQLTELSIPVVLAVNMMDIVRKNGDSIKTKELSKRLGFPVIPISAAKTEGIEELMKNAIDIAADTQPLIPMHKYEGPVEHALAHIEELTKGMIDQTEQRWYAIKLFERDKMLQKKLGLSTSNIIQIEEKIQDVETELDDDSESLITNSRYIYIADVLRGCYRKKSPGSLTTSDKIDKIVTNKWLALPIFALIIWFIYYISVTTVGAVVTEFTNDVFVAEWIQEPLKNAMISAGSPAFLIGLVIDGIIGGLGAVLGFVPQIFVLFILLAIVEECGYMARIAFVLDRIFRKFGLSGKSFIPMLIGTGCSVPGIMASRTIENEHDRRMTIMTTSFMPCGAKLPIIALLSGALFNNASWIATSAYFLGIFSIVISGIMLKKTKPFEGETTPFVMEMPTYHIPALSSVLHSMWERGFSFIKKAGTIILLATILIWLISSYSWTLQPVDNYQGSILQSIGHAVSFIFVPLGFGDDKAGIATILGLVAKETVVATFGILYGVGEVSESNPDLWTNLQNNYTQIQAYSFLMFNLYSIPCFAAIGAIKREMNSTKWTWAALGYMVGYAYSITLIFYNFASLFAGDVHIVGLIFSSIILAGMLYQIFKPYKTKDNLINKDLTKAA